MDKLTSLNLSFDRVLIQFIIPGLLVLFPFVFIFLHHFDSVEEIKFMKKNISLCITIVVLSALIVGIFLENLGSRFEVICYDKKNAKKDSNYLDIWEKFLTLNYNGVEPNGHRYLRNILLRMKFELSIGIGVLFCAIGFIIWDAKCNIIENCFLSIFLFYFLPILICIYLLMFEGLSSSEVLAKTRKILVTKYY